MRPDNEMRAELQRFTPWNRQIILTILSLLGVPKSMLDVGSGIGSMVRLARALGVDAVGVDVLAEPPDVNWDLTKPLSLGQTFDLTISLETAEHLPPEAAGTFCDTISNHMNSGSLLVFSAARPGQGGIGHINLQPLEFWRTLLEARGLTYLPQETLALSNLFIYTSGPATVYLPRNTQVLRCE